MPGYREAAIGGAERVDFPPRRRSVAALVVGLAVVVAGIGRWALDSLTRTTVRCWRGAGEGCVIEHDTPLLGRSSRFVPLASLRGVAHQEHRAKKQQTTHSVSLLTDAGPIELSPRRTVDRRDPERDTIARFLSDPRVHEARVEYDEPLPGEARKTAAFGLAALLAGLYALHRLTTRVAVEIEPALARVTLRRTRWPLAPRVRRLARDEVVRAELHAFRVPETNRSRPKGPGRPRHYVVLALADDRRVELVPDWTFIATSAMEEGVARINAALEVPRG